MRQRPYAKAEDNRQGGCGIAAFFFYMDAPLRFYMDAPFRSSRAGSFFAGMRAR